MADKSYHIIEKDKKYYIECDLDKELVYICKVNALNAKFVEDAAEDTYIRLKRKRKFEKWENSIIT